MFDVKELDTLIQTTNKCLKHACRAKRGYEYWKDKKGLKAFINKKGFIGLYKIFTKLYHWCVEEQIEMIDELLISAKILTKES